MALPTSLDIDSIDNGNGTSGNSANPWISTNNSDENCLAAGLTAVVSFFVAAAWRSEREDAIAKQDEIEQEIMACFEADVDWYCNVDHPQQIRAINTALSIPECSVQCSPCITNMSFEIGCIGDDQCDTEYAEAQINAGLARARHLDRQFAKQRFATCSTNRRNHLIRATNLSFVDYSKAYAYFSNASTIQSGLAGMAAQAYGTAVSEFSYALGILGRSNPSTGSGGAVP